LKKYKFYLTSNQKWTLLHSEECEMPLDTLQHHSNVYAHPTYTVKYTKEVNGVVVMSLGFKSTLNALIICIE
jgi:hypothetical protein